MMYLYKVTKKLKYLSVSKKVLNSILYKINSPDNEIKHLGAFDGKGGIIYCLAHAFLLIGDDIYRLELEKIIFRSKDKIKDDRHYDILSGVAGYLMVLCQVYKKLPSENILDSIIQCGDHLISNSTAQDQGSGWVTVASNGAALAGFSHGAAGIALSLAELYSITKIEKYKLYIDSSISYEDSLFIDKENNWLDLRYEEMRDTLNLGSEIGTNGKKLKSAWCNGAPGIGMSRILLDKLLNNKKYIKNLEKAIISSEDNINGANHSLCHGDMGNIELSILHDIYTNGRISEETEVLCLKIINDIIINGIRCGNSSEANPPGFMVGMAGIGYELLRLAEPSLCPSVLTLQID